METNRYDATSPNGEKPRVKYLLALHSPPRPALNAIVYHTLVCVIIMFASYNRKCYGANTSGGVFEPGGRVCERCHIRHDDGRQTLLSGRTGQEMCSQKTCTHCAPQSCNTPRRPTHRKKGPLLRNQPLAAQVCFDMNESQRKRLTS